jgi:hypothetical protein
MATINYDFLTQQHAIVFLDWDLGSNPSVTCGIKIQSLFILARRGYVIPSDSKYFVFINLSKPLFRQKYLSPHACSPQEQKMYG